MMKKALILVCMLAAGISASAQNVQQSACIAPRGNPLAPVGVIYMHGWFHPSGDTGYVNKERTNRANLQELADRLGVRIAVPLSERTAKKRVGTIRTWASVKTRDGRVLPRVSLGQVETLASNACGARLAVPRQLIGFSDGAYSVRQFAQTCAAKSSVYSAIIMTGAKPAVGGRGGSECAPFYYTGGKDDGETQLQGAQKMMEDWRRQGRVARVLPTFNAGHILPNGNVLASLMGNGSNTMIAQAPIQAPVQPTGVAMAPPIPPRPAVVVQATKPQPQAPRPAQVSFAGLSEGFIR
jgi:hypothetical protein